jgi:predicted PurR-regulated permease PerM
LITLIVKLIVPQLIESVPSLINKLFNKGNEFLDYINNHQNDKRFVVIYDTMHKLNISFDETKFMNEYINPRINGMISTVYSSALGIIIFLKNIIIGIVISFYLLFHKKKMGKQAYMFLYGVFPKKIADNIYEEVKVGDKIFNGFLVGKLIDSLIIWVLAYIGMSILQLPYVPLNSTIIGLTNIIPIFGPLIGAIPCVIFVFIESPIKALICAVFILILQQIDGNVIGPKILGTSTGISSFWILFSIIVFGGFWGITGMIIGIPCFAIIYDLSKKIIYKLLYKKNLDNLIKDYEEEFHKK